MARLTMKPPACLLALLSVSAVLVAQTPSAPKIPATKMTESAVFNWSEMKAEQRPNSERRAAFDNPTATLANFECHVTSLKVGEVSGVAHAHDAPALVEEVILIKEGTVEIEINGTKRPAGAGSVIYFAPKDRTALRNTGTMPAVYFVVAVQAAPVPAK